MCVKNYLEFSLFEENICFYLYLLINIYVIPVKVFPLGYNTYASAFSNFGRTIET